MERTCISNCDRFNRGFHDAAVCVAVLIVRGSVLPFTVLYKNKKMRLLF